MKLREYHPLSEMERVPAEELPKRLDELFDRMDKENVGFVVTEEGKDSCVFCPYKWFELEYETIEVAVDEVLLAQIKEIITPLGWTVERLIVRFLEWLVDPETPGGSHRMAYESQGGTWREMITKETFVKALQLIQEQQEINHQFAKALDLVGDGHYVFGVNNKFYDAAVLVLKEAVNDKYDYISWWLYEGEPDYKVWSSDNTEEWNLTEPEALYDFIVNECQE